MTVKQEMLVRRNSAKEQLKGDLQREIDSLKEFLIKLQEEDFSVTEFSFDVYESGDTILEVIGEAKKSHFINLKNEHNVKPHVFRRFLEEDFTEEGVILKDNKMKITLL